MDRTAWIVVIACLAGMFFYGSYQNEKMRDAAAAAAEYRERQEKAKAAEAVAADDPESVDPAVSTPDRPEPGIAEPPVEPAPDEQTFVLENDYIRAHLTSYGAGLSRVELLKHDRTLGGADGEYVTLNEDGSAPIGALSNGPGQIDTASWQVTNSSESEVVFYREADGLRIQKRFWLPEGTAQVQTEAGSDGATAGSDPHLVKLQITIRNVTETATTVTRRYLYAGSAAPLHAREWSREIGYFWKGENEDMEFESVDSFRKGMFRKARAFEEFMVEDLNWAGINDQFYATLIRAEAPATAPVWASRKPVVIAGEEELSRKKQLHAVHGGVGLPDLPLAPGDQVTRDYEFYLGPKEFSRLADLGEGRKAIMHYDELPIIGWMFGWAIRPLAAFLILSLEWLHGFVPYGVAIILITILIRTLIWPLYAKSTRTMKRMSKLTPKMKELKEKYKDDPQRQNQEIMGLYRKYGVNPLGGCLPMFIQLPIFLGFYRMLSSAVELRHQSFLWVEDLSMEDTLFMIPWIDLPFNLLPILMAITMVIQMKVAPQSGDATQRMIFMLMPIVFLFICYRFAAALSLYWTTQNLFSIGQTWLMNKMPEPELKKKKLPDGGKGGGGGKGFLQRLQEQAEAQQRAKKNKLASERGDRHTPKKRKKR